MTITLPDEAVEAGAKAAAEHAGFAWEACAQSQWMGDARAAITAALEQMVESGRAKRIEQYRGYPNETGIGPVLIIMLDAVPHGNTVLGS